VNPVSPSTIISTGPPALEPDNCLTLGHAFEHNHSKRLGSNGGVNDDFHHVHQTWDIFLIASKPDVALNISVGHQRLQFGEVGLVSSGCSAHDETNDIRKAFCDLDNRADDCFLTLPFAHIRSTKFWKASVSSS
jgi:hypothetical protein